MKLSIIMPSWNQASFLPAALDSVFDQHYPDLEVIVMDGASTDGTVEILKIYAANHPNLVWRSEADDGPADAVNKALAIASGDICGIHSTDDLYKSGSFAAVAKAFEQSPSAQMVFGNVAVIDDHNNTLAENSVPQFSWEAWCGIALCVPQGSIFFKTRLAQELGGWRSNIFGCDIDLWLRMLFRTEPVKVEKTLSCWRRYDTQRTTEQQFSKILSGYRYMIDDALVQQKTSPKQRRLLKAARHLAAVHFSANKAIWTKRKHAFLALLLHPSFPRYAYGNLLGSLMPKFRLLKKAWLKIQPR